MFIIQKDGSQVLPAAFASMAAVETHLEGLQARCEFLADLYGHEPSGSVVARWKGPDGSMYEVRRLCFISDAEREFQVGTILPILTAPGVTSEQLRAIAHFAGALTGKK